MLRERMNVEIDIKHRTARRGRQTSELSSLKYGT